MKVLRIKLTQSKAHYRKEETVDNKMTYPLPPYSTVIGAIHNACNFKTYHEMDISIQGKFESFGNEMRKDHHFLNSTLDDRGILVKVYNKDLLSYAYIKVAEALKATGNSFINRKTIRVYNEKLLEEYISLKNGNNDSDELEKYKTLVISPRYYEVLYNVELVLHIKADDDVLNKIAENIYNIKSIGRSEDFVNVEEWSFVELKEESEKELKDDYSIYLDYNLLKEKKLYLRKDKSNGNISGTMYLLAKNYTVKKGKRVFEKKKVIYTSNCIVEDYLTDGEYIVSLI